MNANPAPLISILIPIRNEAAYIQRCLEAVLAQDYPSDRLEILIADGLSEDGTREKISEFQKAHPQINVFDNPMGIVPTALNILISRAKGEILVRVDGHCVIAQGYIRNCVAHLQEDQVDGVGGPMHSIGEDHISKVIAIAMSSKFLVDTVPFPAYTRAIIDKVGLYDEELVRNQDDEYNYRIRKAGGKILLAADVRSTYYSRGSLKKLWRQYFQYGYYKVRVLQKHPKQMRLRQFIPPTFVSTLILGLLISLTFTQGWMAFTALAGIYMLTNLAASTLIAIRKGWKLFGLLPITFATIHFSYGLGFIAGLFKFWKRWGDKSSKFKVDPLR